MSRGRVTLLAWRTRGVSLMVDYRVIDPVGLFIPPCSACSWMVPGAINEERA